MMTRQYITLLLAILMVSCSSKGTISIVEGDGYSEIVIDGREKLLILPIQDNAPKARVKYMTKDGEITLDVRLARKKIDYTLPLEINGQKSFKVTNLPSNAVAWDSLALSNNYTAGEDKFRPSYHFAPEKGWMNDPNGMVYKDGKYHLFFQYNPYGSIWGNMHWGHTVSSNLVDWEELPVAIAPDKNGAVFSGSCVVDRRNVSGFGKDAIVAFYTSAAKKQTQSIAYSIDNGLSFEKYEGNPVLTSKEVDFRDPKVIYYESTESYVMALAVGQKIEFYGSKNLRDWSLLSSFGEGYGSHGGVWECPDLIEVEVAESGEKRWVLIVSINPGGPAGGSATQYFVGDFDGVNFVCEDEKSEVKWMDYGKDHYATVTWSNVPDGRTLAIAWMSNWEYANKVPSRWFKSSMSIVRELYLFTQDGETYMASKPVDGMVDKRRKSSDISSASEICFDLKRVGESATFTLKNSVEESVDFTVDFKEGTLLVDRANSGRVEFAKTFAASTLSPILGDGYQFRIFVDKASVECFINDGKSVVTNLVFPTEPYTELTFGDGCEVENLKIYNIKE